MVLSGNSNAWLIIRANINLSHFWYQQHTNDQVLVQTDLGRLPWRETGTPAISLASAEWQADIQIALRNLMQYVEQQPWADRVVGFWTAGQVTEEWFAYGSNSDYYGDYSPVNQREFKKWLEANNFPVDDGDNIPSPAARSAGGKIFDNGGARSAFYHQYASDKTAEVIQLLAKTVKEASSGKVLAGVHFGYLLQFAGTDRQTTSATLPSTGKLFKDPNVDFFTGVALLDWRTLDGYDTYVTTVDSLLSHEKLYMVSNDTFSYLHPGHWKILYDENNPQRALFDMHRRVLSSAAVHGINGMWFGLQPAWHGNKELHEEFSNEISVYKNTYNLSRRPTAEIALIVDDTSFAWVPAGAKQLKKTDLKIPLLYLGKSGAPVSLWLLSDIDRLPDHIKLAVITFAEAPAKEDAEKLKAAIKNGGRTFVTIGLPGLVDVEKGVWDETVPPEILGLDVSVDGETYNCFVSSPSEDMTLKEWVDESKGSNRKIRRIRFSDVRATTVERPLKNNGQLLWYASAPTSRTFWRAVAERAGVHCYAPEGFFVYASEELISITSPEDATVEIIWPYSARVSDFFEEWTGTGRKMRIPFRAGQTRLFKVNKK